ncbi:MAG: polyamine aminopropyltransferase [Deltaproteobacteria bacterium]|nr:polyamine aminopropyltransferase [Deltaproteobacteria bacterium]
MKKGWFIEDFEGQAGGLSFKIDEVLYEGGSQYQTIKILKNSFFGNVMLLDDIVMLTEKDEFFYHEMLIHIPMTCVDNPRNVLIIGGGDGGSVREALKHESVEQVVLCEIDKMVIDVAKRYFPALGSCLDDKRVDVVVADGTEYIKDMKSEFDCICIDSTDPIGPGEVLFTPKFYSMVRLALRPGGCMSAQTESPAWSLEDVIKIRGNIKKAFSNAHIYLGPTPCYPSGLWSFIIALTSDKDPAKDFDELRASRIASLCKWYNTDTHRAAFCLPNFIKEAM